MSFKLFILSILICSCGVKSDPIIDKDQSIPSYIGSYLDEKEKKKEEKKEP